MPKVNNFLKLIIVIVKTLSLLLLKRIFLLYFYLVLNPLRSKFDAFHFIKNICRGDLSDAPLFPRLFYFRSLFIIFKFETNFNFRPFFCVKAIYLSLVLLFLFLQKKLINDYMQLSNLLERIFYFKDFYF